MTKDRTPLEAALFWVLPLSFVALVIAAATGVSQGVVLAVLLVLALLNWAAGMARQAARQRRLDEMQVAATRFGAFWAPGVVTLFIILTILPPVQPALVAFGDRFANQGVEGGTLGTAMFFWGAWAAWFVHMIAQSALRAAWMWSKR